MIIKKPGKQEWEPLRLLLTDICKIQKLAGQSEIKVLWNSELGTDINSFGGVYEKTCHSFKTNSLAFFEILQ